MRLPFALSLALFGCSSADTPPLDGSTPSDAFEAAVDQTPAVDVTDAAPEAADDGNDAAAEASTDAARAPVALEACELGGLPCPSLLTCAASPTSMYRPTCTARCFDDVDCVWSSTSRNLCLPSTPGASSRYCARRCSGASGSAECADIGATCQRVSSGDASAVWACVAPRA